MTCLTAPRHNLPTEGMGEDNKCETIAVPTTTSQNSGKKTTFPNRGGRTRAGQQETISRGAAEAPSPSMLRAANPKRHPKKTAIRHSASKTASAAPLTSEKARISVGLPVTKYSQNPTVCRAHLTPTRTKSNRTPREEDAWLVSTLSKLNLSMLLTITEILTKYFRMKAVPFLTEEEFRQRPEECRADT